MTRHRAEGRFAGLQRQEGMDAGGLKEADDGGERRPRRTENITS